jgi:uncharacterized OsmC-like protein
VTTPRRENLVVEARPATHGTMVAARGHELIVDEAERYGGHDFGANPVEHMLAGIASASLVVLRLLGDGEIAGSAALRVSATLNVDRVMGADHGAVFELIRLDWEVQSDEHADRLRAALPQIALRRPGQALIEAAAKVIEAVFVHEQRAGDG